MYCQIEPIKMEQKARIPNRIAGKLKAPNQNQEQKKNNQLKLKMPNQKDKEHKLRHEHEKRRKEGEEKAHEDGGMVG